VSLLDAIPEGILVALDTAIWIYEVEAHAVFGPVVHSFFGGRLGAGRNRAGSSLLALGELLVQPLAAGRADLAARYRAYFTTSTSFSVWDVTREVVETAAALRASYRVKMIDALHLASAIVNHAAIFLCNDEQLRRVKEINVVTLSPHVPGAPP
jgi:predicted nucleic acid-binding protein